MKGKLLSTIALGAALLSGSVAANADSITLTATCDGIACGSASSPNGTLDITNQAFVSVFDVNSLSINSQQFLAPPDLINTNTLDIAQVATGTHTLVIDITASGLTGPNAIEPLLTSFSVSGQSAGWTIKESSFLNGNPLNASPIFSGVDGSGNSTDNAFVSSLFSVGVEYSITSLGSGSINGGIDVATAVPEPATWGMLLLGFVGLGFMFHNRRRMAGLPAAA